MTFCNINFNQKNEYDLFELIDENKIKYIITANVLFIVEANISKKYFDILANNYVTFDGQVPLFIARLFNRRYKKYKKLSGSDIVYDFCEFAKIKNYKMFFLGAKRENNHIATEIIKKQYDIMIDGYSPDFENYPFSEQFNNLCIEKINVFEPDILFVAFGSPKQEYWIHDQLEYFSKIGIKYVIGCGGTFDFISGSIKRAPFFLQKIGLEGLYRFYQEPNKKRLKGMIIAFKFLKYIWHKPDFM